MLFRIVAFAVVWGTSITVVANPPVGVSTPVHMTTSRGWRIAETENFRISSQRGNVDLTKLAINCEECRTRLMAAWYGAGSPEESSCWTPRCEIVIHPTLADYRQSLGPQAGASVGCTSINVQQGRVSQRRIDLRADAADWNVDALPHELTHVVLADRFGIRPLPLWADEGMGVLAESPAKRQIRFAAARKLELQGDRITPAQLFFDSSLPRSSKRDAFYSCSAELVQFLIDRKDAPAFVSFLEHAMQDGIDRALRDHYRIDGVAQLQRLWQADRDLARQEISRGRITLP